MVSAQGAAPRRVGVVSQDEGMAVLVASGLGLAGFAVVRGSLEAQRRMASDGGLAGMVVLGPARDDEPLALSGEGGPASAATLHWDLDDGRDLAALVGEVRGLWPSRVAGAERWASGPVAVPTARILAALGRLRPDVKLVLETAAGTLGVCSVGGRIISAGLAGEAILGDPAVLGDPSLALVLELWGSARAEVSPEARLMAELGFVCEYAELFAKSAGFVAHVERALAATLALPVTAVHVEGHASTEFGIDVLELLRGALKRIPGEALASFIPQGFLHAPTGLPRWLRAALPPQHYGRLFFALEDAVTLGDAVAKSRLDGPEAEVAVALGVLTGAVVVRREALHPRTGRRARPPTTPMPVTARAPAEEAARSAARVRPATTPGLSSVKIAPETEARLAARDRLGPRATPPAGTAPPAHAPLPAPLRAVAPVEPPPVPTRELDPGACGGGAGFFDILRNAAAEAARAGRHPRLTGTRFEPVGEPLDDILLYFRVGSGGTGDVFLGVQGGHGGFQKTIAVKRLVAAHSHEERFRAGFLDEARVAASLEHPNIVHIFRLIEDGARHHLVMEFVHGVSVAQLSAGFRAAHELVPEAVVRFIGAEVARGLHYMHQRRSDEGEILGLVHRDVAPPNILLGFDGSVKLIDLSIAQSNSDPRGTPSSKSSRSGRMGYIAPEVLASVEVGPAADLFGLAATLYELLVGEPCFVRGSPHSTIEAIARADFRPVLKARPDVSPRLAYAIERGLALQPASRFKDLASFREALLRDATEPDPAGRLEAVLEVRFGELRVRERDAMERMRRSAAGHFAAGRDGAPQSQRTRGGAS